MSKSKKQQVSEQKAAVKTAKAATTATTITKEAVATVLADAAKTDAKAKKAKETKAAKLLEPVGAAAVESKPKSKGKAKAAVEIPKEEPKPTKSKGKSKEAETKADDVPAVEKGWKKGQLEILFYLASIKAPATRREIAEATEVNVGGGHLGYDDPEVNSRPVHAGSLLNLGLVSMDDPEENPKKWVITKSGLAKVKEIEKARGKK